MTKEDDSNKSGRRDFMMGAGVLGLGTLAAGLPMGWFKPVADFVVVPANAKEGPFLADIFQVSEELEQFLSTKKDERESTSTTGYFTSSSSSYFFSSSSSSYFFSSSSSSYFFSSSSSLPF